MKIAMVSDYYPQFGTQVVHKIIKYSNRSGLDFFVISLAYGPLGNSLPSGLNIEDDIRVYRVKSKHLEIAGTPYSLPYGMLWEFRRILNREKPDIIHVHHPIFPCAWIAAYMAGKYKIPLIVSCYGAIEGYRSLILTLGSKFILRFPMNYCLRKSQTITAISEKTKRYLVTTYDLPGEKIRVILNGVDTDIFKPQKGQNEASFAWNNSQGKVIGFIGHLRHAKGVHFLIQSATRIIKESNDKVTFVVAGEGPLKQDLITTVKDIGLESFFSFPGYIPDNLLPDFHNSLDIFVQPSLLEGIPQTVVEAMSCGKPVIATNVGGLSEIIHDGENGFLVEPADPSELAERVLVLLNEPDLIERFGRHSRKIAEKELDVSLLCRNYLDTYKQFAGDI